MLNMFCFCPFKLSNSLLPNCQFLFCQATQFCSAKLIIFARGAKAPPAPPLGTPMRAHYIQMFHVTFIGDLSTKPNLNLCLTFNVFPLNFNCVIRIKDDS